MICRIACVRINQSVKCHCVCITKHMKSLKMKLRYQIANMMYDLACINKQPTLTSSVIMPLPKWFCPKTFAYILRYMITAAQDKRAVTYHELEKIFCLGHNMVGLYAGMIGDYCLYEDLPMLNALIINSSECMPSGGFTGYIDAYNEQYEFENNDARNWGELVAECWSHYHVKQNKQQQFGSFSNLSETVNSWLSSIK